MIISGTIWTQILIGLLALLAIGMTVCKHPMIMAGIVVIESIVISIYLGITKGFNTPSVGIAILICLFAFFLAGIVYYCDRSFNTPLINTSKSTILIGIILCIFIIIEIPKIKELLAHYAPHQMADLYY